MANGYGYSKITNVLDLKPHISDLLVRSHRRIWNWLVILNWSSSQKSMFSVERERTYTDFLFWLVPSQHDSNRWWAAVPLSKVCFKTLNTNYSVHQHFFICWFCIFLHKSYNKISLHKIAIKFKTKTKRQTKVVKLKGALIFDILHYLLYKEADGKDNIYAEYQGKNN